MALSLNDEINHIALVHKMSLTKFKCTKCNKKYISKQGAVCHIPKCTGPKNIEGNTLTCSLCGKTFKSKSGLAQHERHEHPFTRNEARRALASKSKPKGFGHTWSKDEIELMHKLEIQLMGEKRIANKMSEYLPNKTNKQIRDK
jgi:hypothetical protein